MRHSRQTLGPLFVLVALTGLSLVAPPLAHGDDAPLTWAKAVVYLPGETQPTTVDRIPADRKHPAIIYIHGCSGITGGEGGDNHRWAKLLAAQGLLVVMPDSMARGDRKPSCDPAAHKGGLFPPVYGMRLEEIRYAAEQIRTAPWFSGRLFLMGHSEGGMSVARTKLAGFAGVVISGWTCTNKQFASFDGVFAPAETPVLAMKYEDDPWYPSSSPAHGSCESKLAGRSNAKYVSLPGRGHGTYDSEAARAAVVVFIGDLMKK